jgi:hypothetical protein
VVVDRRAVVLGVVVGIVVRGVVVVEVVVRGTVVTGLDDKVVAGFVVDVAGFAVDDGGRVVAVGRVVTVAKDLVVDVAFAAADARDVPMEVCDGGTVGGCAGVDGVAFCVGFAASSSTTTFPTCTARTPHRRLTIVRARCKSPRVAIRPVMIASRPSKRTATPFVFRSARLASERR